MKLYLKSDIGVLVHTEYFGIIDNGQLLDVLAILLERLGLGRKINTRRGILIIGLESLGREESLQNGAQTPLIPRVRDTTTIRDLARDINESIPGYSALFAEHLKVEQRTFTIRVREVILNIPAQRAELASLLDNSVEEADAEHDFAPVHGENVLLEKGRLYFSESASNIGTQTFGRLVGHFHTVLEHTYLELIATFNLNN